MSEAVGVGACFDDGPVEGEPVDDCCAEAGIGEGFRPPREGLVTGDRDGVLLFAFGEDLEEEFGAAPVEFGLSEQLGLDPRLADDNEDESHWTE